MNGENSKKKKKLKTTKCIQWAQHRTGPRIWLEKKPEDKHELGKRNGISAKPTSELNIAAWLRFIVFLDSFPLMVLVWAGVVWLGLAGLEFCSSFSSCCYRSMFLEQNAPAAVLLQTFTSNTTANNQP